MWALHGTSSRDKAVILRYLDDPLCHLSLRINLTLVDLLDFHLLWDVPAFVAKISITFFSFHLGEIKVKISLLYLRWDILSGAS